MTVWTAETHQEVTVSFRTSGVLYHDQSPYQTVDVVETVPYGRMLLLEGAVMTTDKDEFVYHEMISHVPMLAHPNPKRVLVIGGGDGGAVRELLKHPEVESIVLCEIDGMVIDACKQYFPAIAGQLGHPKVTVNVGDGVAYMETARDFDVILIDSTDPIGPGEGLFTEAFYRNAFRALAEDGILVAQTESPFLDAHVLRTMSGIFHRVFPIVKTYTGSIPTYPSGYWTWTFCSKQHSPKLSPESETRAKAIEQTCQYYNRDVHHASFALPNFVRELTAPTPEPVA